MAKGSSKQADEPTSIGRSSASVRNANAPDAHTHDATQTSQSEEAFTPPPLHISRNKLWRLICSFQGDWLQIPVETLQTIANINYNTPEPRPIDPAVFFDLIKVRRLVDEATDLAVRASGAFVPPGLTTNSNNIRLHTSLEALGIGGNGHGHGQSHGAKLSKERMSRMREQASQKLARAYCLDEIACSVAATQGSSLLEKVGSLVLQLNSADVDARYVHFFTEKVLAWQMPQETSVKPITDIISDRPGHPEFLRTRAIIKGFKEDYKGAAQDLTNALAMCRTRESLRDRTTRHTRDQNFIHKQSNSPARHPHDIILSEDDQPNGLEAQLLFRRGAFYLSAACHCILPSFPTSESIRSEGVSSQAFSDPHADTGEADGATDGPRAGEPTEDQVKARNAVKSFAKHALRDYLSFLSHYSYSPDLPVKISKDFSDKANQAANAIRTPRCPESRETSEPHHVYSVSTLFAAVPPPNLPSYPPQDLVQAADPAPPDSSQAQTCEKVTYHPLLNEALHSLLLCHVLTQTSAKEIQRHAYMAARLIRLTDDYSIFQDACSPAEADWVEVLRLSNERLQLDSPWEDLCDLVPLSLGGLTQPKTASCPKRAITIVNGRVPGQASLVRQDQTKGPPLESTTFGAPEERLNDQEISSTALGSRSRRLKLDSAETGDVAVERRRESDVALRRLPTKNDLGCSIRTERAVAISRWLREALVVTGTTRRKKRTRRPGNRTDGPAPVEKTGNLDAES